MHTVCWESHEVTHVSIHSKRKSVSCSANCECRQCETVCCTDIHTVTALNTQQCLCESPVVFTIYNKLSIHLHWVWKLTHIKWTVTMSACHTRQLSLCVCVCVCYSFSWQLQCNLVFLMTFTYCESNLPYDQKHISFNRVGAATCLNTNMQLLCLSFLLFLAFLTRTLSCRCPRQQFIIVAACFPIVWSSLRSTAFADAFNSNMNHCAELTLWHSSLCFQVGDFVPLSATRLPKKKKKTGPSVDETPMCLRWH